MIFFNLIIPNNNKNEYKFSNITLKIKESGEHDILFSNFYYSNPPDIISLNGKQKNSKNYIYNFNKINNTVNLIWNNPINSSCRMFEQCSKITEIDLSNFDTSEVTEMSQMFSGCSKLTSINLTKFNTSKVQQMHSMFMGCSQLTSLDLSYFDTSKVNRMQHMFSGCSQLVSLDLSNFDTSKVQDMQHMFSGCSQLVSLDLSNFDTSKVSTMQNMFSGCSKLEYINLSNFIESNQLSVGNIFYVFNALPDNIVVCLNENSNLIYQEIIKKNCYTLDCSDNWQLKQKKKVVKNNFCKDTSNNSVSFYYEYQGLYYETCKNGNVTNNHKFSSCNCDNELCSSCPDFPLKETLCVSCKSIIQ